MWRGWLEALRRLPGAFRRGEEVLVLAGLCKRVLMTLEGFCGRGGMVYGRC